MSGSKKKLKLALLRQQDYRCHYCAYQWPRTSLRELRRGQHRMPTFDHKTAPCFGGTDDPANLAIACRKCNNLKDRLDELTYLAVKDDPKLRKRLVHLVKYLAKHHEGPAGLTAMRASAEIIIGIHNGGGANELELSTDPV